MKTLDAVDVRGKTVLVRIDINASIGENGKIQNSPRFSVHGQTIKELLDKQAKVVLLGHQGRPGNKEFRSLAEHAELLASELGMSVEFVPDVAGPAAINKIGSMQEGDVILLENLRFLADEAQDHDADSAANVGFVKALAGNAQVFVNDAFSVCHRPHASVIGFPHLLPSAAGRALQQEVNAVEKIMQRTEKSVFLFGGLKVREVMNLANSLCKNEKAEAILLAGLPGLLFLKAKGMHLGEANAPLLETVAEFLPLASELLKRHGHLFATPVDLAVDIDEKRKEYLVTDFPVNYVIHDIGLKTAQRYGEVVKNAGAVFAKGVPGEFEKPGFSLGTIQLGETLTHAKGFTVIGGGAWSTAFQQLGLDATKLSHVSLSGGALLEALAGKKLPGIEALT
ncbi:phosphoglycerate kinase [Candidatus Micrarchaeota archaeon]|nr:phosphoglycerate kinase [Candidatus Micrarchaeota archaeon]